MKGVGDSPVLDEVGIDLEMNIEQATFPSRIVQQALWLAFSDQQVMEVVTNHRALSKLSASLTFWNLLSSVP